jgi:uncharacterized protein YdeI (YjbR/CyaY-like superfamily)
MKPAFFASAAEFHSWLERHHDSAAELLLGLHKKSTGRGLTYRDALDEALAYGWIDGVRKRLDDDAYTIRFTPRKLNSVWSAVNIKRVEELIAGGRMQSAGLRAFERRDEKKARQYSYERETQALDPTLAATLRAHQKASDYFAAQPPGYRKIVTFWIMSAKKEETRVRRLAHLIERSASGARIDLLKPGKT